jgi:restriction endonuclease Mrr
MGGVIGLTLLCAVISFALSVTQTMLDGIDRLWQLSPLLVIGGSIVAAACVCVIVWAGMSIYFANRTQRTARQQAQAAEAERLRLMQIAAAEAARQAYLARLRTLNGLVSLTPTEFEQAVGQMLTVYGYRNVQRTGGAGDLAADLTCIAPDGRSTVVQCKRYSADKLIDSPTIQTFIGMVTVHHRAGLGIFVTTSGYTQPAMKLAQQHSAYLQLIDGPQVADMMRRVS